jgi:sulfur carrier protein
MPLTLVLNGKPRTLEELGPGATIRELVDALGVKADRVALEHNHEIAPRGSWSEIAVADGDHIELVHFVGGGANY